MSEEMDDSNLRAPMVIQASSCEEQKDQDLNKIHNDELEPSKDYVIDQIFCGENLTIYALFEVSDSSGEKSEKHFIEVSDSPTIEDFKFYHRSSYKESIEVKEINGFKSNYQNFSADEIELTSSKDKSQMTESSYHLKTYSQYEVTTGVNDSSDLKVLYSKNEGKDNLKLVSKGVNTDIAQCPKLVKDVRKAISINKPLTAGDGRTIEIQAFPPVKSSYEIIEVETAQSSCSCGLDVEDCRRNHRKSSPNVLLVPLLMMDEGMLNTLKVEDKNQHNKGEELPLPEKTSLGVNTDFSCSEFLGEWKDSDNSQESENKQTRAESPNPPDGTGERCDESKGNEKKEENDETESESELTSKKSILKEIKHLQAKLNTLIKFLESSESNDSKPQITSGEENPPEIQLEQPIKQPSVERIESTTELKPVKRNPRRYDDLPIFSSDTSNTSSAKPLSSKPRKKPFSAEREVPKESLPTQAKSTVSILTSTVSSLPKTPFAWNENDVKGSLIKELDKKRSCCVNFTKDKKILPVAKSECSIQFRLLTPVSKCGFYMGLRKTLSFESGGDKPKKLKCPSNKFDGNFKTKDGVRVHSNMNTFEHDLPNSLTPFICEMGDEIGNKPRKDILIVEEKLTDGEGLLEVLEKEPLVLEVKKTSQDDDEGDVKDSYETPFSTPSLGFTPKNERVVVNYCNTYIDRTLKTEKSFKKLTGQPIIKSGLSIDMEPKVSGQENKPTTPTTPNKNDKKVNMETNSRKELKNGHLNKSKIPDRINKNGKKESGQSESVKPRQSPSNRPKTSGQTKPNVDKPIKKASPSPNEITSNKALAKPEKEEKSSGRNDQHHSSKTTSQKRDHRERETTPNENKSSDSDQNQTLYSNYSQSTSQIKIEECYSQKHDLEEKMLHEDKHQVTNLLTDSSSVEGPSNKFSSVIVELFSKKQSSIADSQSEYDQDFAMGPDIDTSHIGLNEKDLVGNAEDTDGTFESGVQSVWALTKVLLYGDGTKKFEVLEVSLTPPECALDNEN